MPSSELIQPLFLPRGVAEPSGNIGYVANGTDNIEAIDLSNGRTIWISNEASNPLLATNNWLAAQKMLIDRPNAFQIAKLDTTRNGSLISLSEPIVFPRWVVIQTFPSEGFSFKVRASTDNLFLDWRASSRYQGGANPPSYILQQESNDTSGTIRFDLETGEVEMLPLIEQLPQILETSLEEQFGFAWWIAGRNLAALVWDESRDQQILSLRTRRITARDTADRVVELVRGRGLASYVTPDGCYVLVHPEISAEQLEREKPWWIFSAETGHLLATLTYEGGTKTASIIGSKIYYLVEKSSNLEQQANYLAITMKAKDLASGILLWEHPFEDERFYTAPPLPQ